MRKNLGTRVTTMLVLALLLGALPAAANPMHGLRGVVRALPEGGLIGDWQVAFGQMAMSLSVTVHVSAATVIDESAGPVAVGAGVAVQGRPRPDGTLDATRIEVQGGGGPGGGACSVAILHLTPTPAAPAGAEGVVVTRSMALPSTGLREDLKVMVGQLVPATDLEVFVDGFHAGTIRTGANGGGHLFLSTADIPGAEPLPPELRPVTGLGVVTVVDAGGAVLLEGDLATARTAGCGGHGLEYLAMAVLRSPDDRIVGAAMARAGANEQEVDVVAARMEPGATYALVIDSVAAGNAIAGPGGMLHLRLSTNPHADDLPLPEVLLPVTGLVHAELHAADGSLVAAGEFRPVSVMTPPSTGGWVRRGLRH